MEDTGMGLVNGSDEYWKIHDHAERICNKKCDSTGSEREMWDERGKNLADQLREEFGYGDRVVKDLIERYYLDRD